VTQQRPSSPIASPQNPRVRAAAALRNRRDRIAVGRFLIDGAREVRRAIEARVEIDELFVSQDDCRTDDCRAVLAAAAERRIRRVDVEQRAFEKLAFGDRAEGVVAVARTPSVELSGLRLPSDPLVVVLEGVEKPGNLGAVLRSADGAGADALIATGDGVDLFNPNAIRASLGTIFSVPLAAAPADEVRDWLRERGVRILAARVEGAALYTDGDLRGPLALVFGSEAEGLTDSWAGEGIEAIRLPMLGIADSLNVSVAAAVLLYEARRQRGDRQATARK
jgi:TrmH family RNA methyltransferase